MSDQAYFADWEKEHLKEYATGGYTGSWGDNQGKLAVLHEK